MIPTRTVKLTTPCCGSRVRGASRFRTRLEVMTERTCPTCGVRWTIFLAPRDLPDLAQPRWEKKLKN